MKKQKLEPSIVRPPPTSASAPSSGKNRHKMAKSHKRKSKKRR